MEFQVDCLVPLGFHLANSTDTKAATILGEVR